MQFRNVIGWIFTGSIVSLVVWAGYSITMELFGRASPTNLFDETFEIIRISDEVRFSFFYFVVSLYNQT